MSISKLREGNRREAAGNSLIFLITPHAFRLTPSKDLARLGRTVGVFFVSVFLLSSCAPRQERTIPAASASAKALAAPHCPDRVDRAKTGGFVGGVFGTVVATLVGSPVLGTLYQVAGYGIGFASADACKKQEVAAEQAVLTPQNGQVAVEKAVLTSPKPEVAVEKVVLTQQPQQRHPVLVSTEIKEENLSSGKRP